MNEMKKELELTRRFPEANPFGMMRRFTQDMERMFDDFAGFRFPRFFRPEFAPFRTELEKAEWIPQIEVLHKDGTFMVRADLPGLTKDDVKIEVTNELLTISGERKTETEEKHEGFYRTERLYGTFFRQIPLPEGVKTDNATATFRHGVLEITLPMPKFEIPVRKLEIKEPTEVKAAKATA
jgi:HSP20 family protein